MLKQIVIFLYGEGGLKPGTGTRRSNAEAHVHPPFVLLSDFTE